MAAIPAQSPNALKQNSSREVRVLITSARSGTITGYDLILNGRDQLEGNSFFSFRCSTNKKGEWSIHTPQEKGLKKLEITSPGGFLTFQGKTYRNKISVIAKDRGCLVINTLDLEKYLSGLINKEMSPSWPMAALKAQAVASRTYALFQMEENRHQDFDLESTTADQVYAGASAETAKSNQATEETKGEILAYSGSPIKAYFHANCGGKTEAPEFVWGQKNPAFRSVYCPYHRTQKEKVQWEVRLSKQQIYQAVKKIAGSLPKSFFHVAQVEAGAPNGNQRLSDIMVSDARGNSLVISSNAFRNAIGNTKFRSTSFQLKKEGDAVRFIGEGFGHGVGMCQVGAKAMADEGKNYREILSHYYPLAQVRPAHEFAL